MSSWKPKIVDLSNGTVTLLTTQSLVKGIYVDSVMSAHSVEIANGSETLLIIPASLAAATVLDFAGEQGVVFDNNVIIKPNGSATGKITIMYQERVV